MESIVELSMLSVEVIAKYNLHAIINDNMYKLLGFINTLTVP